MRLVICYLLFTMILCPSISSHARESKGEKLTAQETKALVTQVEKSFCRTSTLKTCFDQQKQIALFEETVMSKGLLFFQTPGKIRMDLIYPIKTSIIMNHSSMAEYEHIDDKWYKLPQEKNRMSAVVMDNIIDWLQGKFNENAVYTVTGFKTDINSVLKLIPNDENFKKYIDYFELGVNKNITGLDYIIIMQPDGDFTRYNFYNDGLNADLPGEIFNTSESGPFPVSLEKQCFTESQIQKGTPAAKR